MRLIALLCFFTSFIASANSYQFLTSRGVDTLDGPSVIECPNKGTAELLDLYGMEWNGLGLKDGPTSSAEEKISELTARLIVLDPRRANQLDKRAKEIVKEVVFHQDVDFGPVEGPGDEACPKDAALEKLHR